MPANLKREITVKGTLAEQQINHWQLSTQSYRTSNQKLDNVAVQCNWTDFILYKAETDYPEKIFLECLELIELSRINRVGLV